jgi:hypothetical protein
MSGNTREQGRRSYLLVGAAVFAVALAMRTVSLHWSPLPFNPDGIRFAALAERTLATGVLPPTPQPLHGDEFAFVLFHASVSAATGVRPLSIAQPTIALLGASVPLLVVSFARRVGARSFRPADTRAAAALAGLLLATEGLYLRRSAAVSSEVVGLLFVVLLALAVHRGFETRRPAWGAVAVVLLGVFPITHNLSTMIGGLVLTALVALHVHRRPTTDTLLLGAGTVLAFWTYLFAYDALVGLNDFGRASGAPGFFFTWVIVLLALAVWLSTAGPRAQRGVPMTGLLFGVAVLAANAVIPVFPETADTPLLLLALVAPVILLGLLGTWGITSVADRASGAGVPVLALLVGPLALIAFSLTADLTPVYFNLVGRAQTFVHPAVMILAALATVALAGRHGREVARSGAGGGSSASQSGPEPGFRRIVVPVVLACALVSAPLAFGGLHAFAYQSTTTPAEFGTAEFATTRLTGSWAGDDHVRRIASNYYPNDSNGSTRPVYRWLRSGGTPPGCPTVVQESWTTVGAQPMPAAPARIGSDRYRGWLANRNVVYVTGGSDPLRVVASTGGEMNC